MKHFRQPYNGCFPTAIGCYLERPPEDVINEILSPELQNQEWWKISNPSHEMFSFSKFKIDLFLNKHIAWLPIEAYVRSDCYMLKLLQWPRELTGRGFITFLKIDNSVIRYRHIVAFDGEQGLIYDTNYDKPSLYEYYKYSAMTCNYFVEKIFREPKKEIIV